MRTFKQYKENIEQSPDYQQVSAKFEELYQMLTALEKEGDTLAKQTADNLYRFVRPAILRMRSKILS